MSPYTTLGLPEDAPIDDVKKAYKKLALELHPDRNKGDKEKEEKFKQVNLAYQSIISGDYNRQKEEAKFYQERRFHGGFTHGFSANDDLFEILQKMHSQMRPKPTKNEDFFIECYITLEDAFNGKEITIKVDDTKELKVKIPIGINDGHRLRVPQAGSNTNPGLAPGDLFVIVRINQHERFHPVGINLVTSLTLDLFDSILGTSVSIVGIDGKNLNVNIPELTKPDTKIRIPGHGMPILGKSGRGDLYIIPEIRYPDKLSNKQKKVLKDMLLSELEDKLYSSNA